MVSSRDVSLMILTKLDDTFISNPKAFFTGGSLDSTPFSRVRLGGGPTTGSGSGLGERTTGAGSI